MRHRVLVSVLSICAAVSALAASLRDPMFLKTVTVVASDKAHDVLKSPVSVAVDRITGDIVVADRLHHRIVRVAATGQVRPLAGAGAPGRADGSGAQAQFKEPCGVAIDSTRRLIYVADSGNHVIRSVTFDGLVGTFAGSGLPDDHDGVGTQAGFKEPHGIVVDASGMIWVADTGNNRIRQITPEGVVTTVAGIAHEGLSDGRADMAQFKQPEGIAVGPDGALYIADTKNNVIRRLYDNAVTTIAGTGRSGSSNGTGGVAEFKKPSGITCDKAGNLYVADTQNHCIRRISTSGAVVVTTLTGSSKAGFVDGSLNACLFRDPSGLAFAGALYVADSGNDAIRRIDAAVRITSIDPQFGPAAGGTDVHVVGGGFVPGITSVTFGTTAAASITYINSGEIVATTPVLGAGVFDVTATTPGGSATLPSAFATIPPPTIATVTPRKGTTAGGELVTITGTDFTSTMTVTFGSAAANVVHVGSNSATVLTPPNAPGTFDVTTSTAGGTATRSAVFTYFAPPVIANFTPANGAAGTVVTINGANFDPEPAGDVVLFGSLQAMVTNATPSQLVVTVPNGATTGRVTVRTAGGTAISATDFATTSYTSLEITAPVTAFEQGDTVPFNAIARLLDGSTADVSTQAVWTTSDGNVATVSPGSVTGRIAGSATITASLGGFSASKPVVIRAATIPVAVPSKIDNTVVQPLADTIRFLYSGPNAIQTGVAPGTINDDRVATVRGRVRTRDGAPVAGVEIAVGGHPELGHTFTRSDGVFDLAVNGGGTLTLVYRKAAWLEAHRLVTSRWNDQKVVDDVVLVPFDAATSLITMSNAATQSGRATKTIDIDGERTATMIFPAGESATVTLPNGRTTTPAALHIRATEYTIGESGPTAMPAPLPTMSGYTYCVELSADEAAGGTVQFSKPLSFYIENFLDLPVGSMIPSGYYDRSKQSWVGSNNGRVVRIVSIGGGIATLDTNGDGAPESDAALASLGFDEGERRALASIYTAGQTLWRMRMNHFTPWDHNMTVKPPGNAKKPKGKKWNELGKTWAKCKTFGWSIVDCANQSLGESIPLQGTPYALEYNSSRAGRMQYSAEIELSDGDPLPESLERIDLKVTIAGRQESFSFAPQSNLRYTYTWDGTDEFGRMVSGARRAELTVTYVYPMLYAPGNTDPGWNVPADVIAGAIRRAGKFQLSTTTELLLGHFDTGNAGFGGWSFSGQRLYDGIGRMLYEPGGNERSSDPQQTHETEIRNTPITAAGTTPNLYTIASTPDGSIYFGDSYRIKKRTLDGAITTVAGGTSAGFTPDGVDAAGNPANPWQIATGPDGTLYVIDATRVRAIINERWVTVAGTNVYEPGGTYALAEGVAATTRPVTAWSLTVGADGALYIGGLSRIYKVDVDRTIHTVAGGGTNTTFVDGASAFTAKLGTVYSVAVAPDGTIYYANDIIVGRITPDGRIYRVPGTFRQPHGVSVASDGTLLVADANGFKVWEITPDGTTRVFAGNGTFAKSDVAPIGMSRSVAALPWEVKVAPDGSAWVLDLGYQAIRHADTTFPPSRTAIATVVPSEGGGVAYVFESGRHTRTVNALNGVTLETFAYAGDGNLVSVTNVDGLVTRIERNASGDPIAVVAPNGQRTTLSIVGGQLRSITDPSGASYAFDYNATGLLAKLTDRRGGLHQFTYDDDGLLIRDDDPVGGFIALGRVGTGPNFNTTRSSAEGRVQSVASADDGVGSTSQTSVGSTGLSMTSSAYGATESVSSPAVSITLSRSADSRFGMLSSLPAASVSSGSRTLQISRSRTTTLSSPDNVLAPSSITSTTTINGSIWTSTYDATTRVLTSRTPAGRQTTATFDAKGRPVITRVPLITDAVTTYDTRGRVATMTQGTRTTLFAYDGFDRVASITDPLLRTVSFTYDEANRVTTKTLADGRTIGYTYDAAGNVTAMTPPSRPAHLFSFTGIDFPDTYTVPGGGATKYRYNHDRQVTSLTRPDGTEITNHYDTAGRLSSVSTPSGNFTLSYTATTGLVDTVTAPSGIATRYTYDGVLPTKIDSTGMVNGSISIAYDGDLRVTSKTIGTTAPITYGYDGDGLLTAIGIESIGRDAANGRVTTTTAGVINDVRAYDAFGQISDYNARLNATPVFKQHYTRDAGGRIASIDETIGTTTVTRAFGYDTAGRLLNVKENGSTVASYTYDGNSNRLSRTASTGTETGIYDDQDRVTRYGGFTFTYTPNGEIATKTSAFGTTAYGYDSFGNLTSVTLPNGRVITYVLDGRQRRVAKKIDGVITQKFLYADGLRPIAELAADDSVRYRFLYGERTNVPSLIVGASATYRVISDHVGSARAIVHAGTGTSVEYLAYDEFGNVTTDTSPGLQPFGFAGGLYDSDTHLVHFGARDYDPSLGRFLSRDPLGFGGGQSNVYDYAANDPVNFTDPSGLLPGDEAGEAAQEYYSDTLTDPKASTAAKVAAAIGGTLAALWTPCTSHATLATLLVASTVELNPAYTAGAGVAVIGHWPEYTRLAEQIGANYFSVPPAVWEAMTPTEQWAANQQFLEEAVRRGDVFRLATPLNEMRDASFFAREVDFLMNEQRYVLNEFGDSLLPGIR